MYRLSQSSERRLQGIEPVLIDIVKDSIAHPDCPHDFGIPRNGGMRTAEDQHKLYQQGRDLPGSIITYTDGYTKKSYHQTGKAFDIYGFVDGKATWNKDVLTDIARHIQRVAMDNYCVELEWGGDWKKFKDYPHFQI